MSIKIMSLIWDEKNGVLTAIEKSVLLKLADFSADNGTQIFPSVHTISLETALSKSTVIRTIKSLETKKILNKKSRTSHNGSLTSNSYSLNVQLLQKLASDKSWDIPNDPSVTETLPPLSQVQDPSVSLTPPSVSVTPNTSLDPSLLNNNNTTAESEGTKLPRFEQKPIDVVVALRKDLNDIGVLGKTADEVLESYQPDKIRKYLDHTNNPKTTIRSSKAGFFLQAIKNDWAIPSKIDKKSKSIEDTEEQRLRDERLKVEREIADKIAIDKFNEEARIKCPHLFNEDGSYKQEHIRKRA